MFGQKLACMLICWLYEILLLLFTIKNDLTVSQFNPRFTRLTVHVLSPVFLFLPRRRLLGAFNLAWLRANNVNVVLLRRRGGPGSLSFLKFFARLSNSCHWALKEELHLGPIQHIFQVYLTELWFLLHATTGDPSRCLKPPVDFKTKVPLWPG